MEMPPNNVGAVPPPTDKHREIITVLLSFNVTHSIGRDTVRQKALA